MLTALTELSFVARIGFAVLQAPPQKSTLLPDFVYRITPTEWVVIAIVAVVLLGVILCFFTIDGIELGFPPKIIWIRLGNCSTNDVESLIRKEIDKIKSFVNDEFASFLALS